MALLKLAVSNIYVHKARVALTVAAIALSVSLVVSVTSGYASATGAIFKYLNQFMGSVDVEIRRKQNPAVGIPESVLADLRKDPDVEGVDGRYETNNLLTDVPGEESASSAIYGVRRPEDRRSDFLKMDGGQWFETSKGEVAVIDQGVAEGLKLKVGDEFLIPTPNRTLKLRVCGIVHKPEMLAKLMKSIYVPMDTLQAFAGKDNPPMVSRIMVDLKLGADDAAFVKRWEPVLKKIDPQIETRLARETRREMEKNLQGLHLLSYMGGAISLLAATFITFSALSMGVSERQRTLAMLRAVGAQRGQIGRLVVLEGLFLAILGVVVGVPLGWLWISALAWWYHDIFTAGVIFDRGGLIFGSIGSVLAALAASLLPAWSAMRVSPLEAMTPLADPPPSRPPWRSFVCGLLLVSIDPFLMFGPVQRLTALFTGARTAPDVAREVKFFGHFGLGLAGLMVGFFLMAPMLVWVLERLAGPLVAAMFGLRFALLRQQLSSGIWRVAGTCAALMVGLAVLVVLQTNGKTLLKGWVIPDKFPDIFVMTSPLAAGLDQDQIKRLNDVPGIRKGEVTAIGVASPELGAKFFQVAQAAITLPDATMFIGIEPDKAFKMMGLEFREGNSDEAARLLAQGDHLVITEEFRQLKGLGKGDKFPLKTKSGEIKQFTIAAVVWSPGIDVMVVMYDMNRQFDQRTAASVFGSLDDGRKYFGIDQVYLFAANLDYFVEREQILERVQKTLGRSGMVAGDVRQIKYEIVQGLSKLILLVSSVAFAAMVVSSLGVTNTIMASIRTRRWQFGILRSIGVTRAQLLRLVLAEAFLIGMVGCALGVAAGLLLAIDAGALTKAIAGYAPPLAIPWPVIWVGMLIVMGISLLASIWPAVSVARSQPLELLQAGRAAA
jgi:putative ABC transport system permease protein